MMEAFDPSRIEAPGMQHGILPYRKPELGKDYWIQDNILPDPFAVAERCFNKSTWIMGAPWRPEPWPGMRAPDALLPAELAIIEQCVRDRTGVRSLRPQADPAGGSSGHNFVQLVGGGEEARDALLVGDEVKLEIEVAAEGAAARLTVTDHGQGVPASERARIFEPFFRASAAGEARPGAGLGLALVRQIARRHKGDAAIEATASGTAFVVRLPV